MKDCFSKAEIILQPTCLINVRVNELVLKSYTKQATRECGPEIRETIAKNTSRRRFKNNALCAGPPQEKCRRQMKRILLGWVKGPGQRSSKAIRLSMFQGARLERLKGNIKKIKETTQPIADIEANTKK